MQVTQLEQSGCILEAANGFRLGIDIGSYTPAESLHGLQLDALLVSHIHGDHFFPAHIVQLVPQTVYLPGECIAALGDTKLPSAVVQVRAGEQVVVGPFHVTPFDVDHGPNVTTRPKENFGFLIEGDDAVVYFAGDMFYPSGLAVTDLRVTHALIPVGGFYTFGPEEAVAFTKQFAHIDTVLPMHYQKNPEAKKLFYTYLQ